MRDTLSFLKQLVTSGSKESSSRFLSIHTTLVVTYCWLFVSIWKRDIQDIPSGVIAFCGIVIGGYVGQKIFAEAPNYRARLKQEGEDEKCQQP